MKTKHTKTDKRFKLLAKDWADDQLTKDTPLIYKEISKTAIQNVQLSLAKKFDQDLLSLKEKIKVANEMYGDGEKTNKAKIEFLIEILQGRGEDVPSIDDFLKNASNGETE